MYYHKLQLRSFVLSAAKMPLMVCFHSLTKLRVILEFLRSAYTTFTSSAAFFATLRCGSQRHKSPLHLSSERANRTMATTLTNDQLYHGHKVVAMPSSACGGMSVRNVVSSKNTDYLATSPRCRSRSRSSRGSVSRSRDIVQDVYDRMGVNYTR
jgi:hypothetical protein